MNRKLILLLTLICISVCCYSQMQNSQSSLMGKKWIKKERYETNILEFSRDSIIDTSKYSLINKTVRYSKPYYLSDNIPTSFDFTKVGKPSQGKYLIDYNDKVQELEYCEIKALDDNKLILFYEQKDGYIGGADMTVTYTRMKPEDE